MGIFDGYLLVSDIDGTLLERGKISERSIEAIKYFVSEGGKFALATGRAAFVAKELYERVGANSPSVVYNGAMIYDYENDKVLKTVSIDDSVKPLILHVLNNEPKVGIEIFAGDNPVALRINDKLLEHLRYESLPTIEATYREMLQKDWIKVVFITETPEEISPLEKTIKEFPAGGYNCVRSYEIYCEILSDGASKALALKDLGEIVKAEKVCCIGDYYNDLDMLKAAPISATTADAPEEIKNVVDFVGGSCLNGAVADFIEYLKINALKG